MKSKAFTLIELLVVISIIGVIASIVLVSFSGQRDKARLARAQQFSAQISHALGAYAVGIWRFEEGGGATAHDESGFGNDGTLHGNAQWVDSGVVSLDGVIRTDGDTDYFEISDNNTLDITTSITVESWVNGDRWSTNDLMVHKSSAYGLWYDWTGSAADDNEFQFMFYGAGWRVCDSDFTPQVNTWYYIVGTYNYDIHKCSFYVNGDLKKTTNYTQQINNGTVLRIGGWTDNNRFKGMIGDVKIYNHALSAAQIQQHYVQGAAKHGIALK
ncbi:prepilin-type N-terminal cleavage/methylation domain-containing protein [Candidatus Parcubacteria bacterium]|nr:prepilin-type N-terminal cleavage/methylation domain-containing protein [Candidatus Parcubacteria bacterium]